MSYYLNLRSVIREEIKIIYLECNVHYVVLLNTASSPVNKKGTKRLIVTLYITNPNTE